MPKRRLEVEPSQQGDDSHALAGSQTAVAMHSNDTYLSGEDGTGESESHTQDTSRFARRVLASVACNTCRSRKSKCDEQWPVCGNCARLKLRCKYEQRRKSKIHTYLEKISSSLQKIEHNTDHLASKLEQFPNAEYSSTTKDAPALSLSLASCAPSDYGHSEHDKERLRHLLDLDFPQFRHITALHELYTWPPIARALPGVDLTYPVTSERSRKPLTASIVAPYCLASPGHSTHGEDWWDSMNISQVRTLLNHYFDDFHQVYPVVEKWKLLEFGRRVTLENGFGNDSESCVVLITLALGNLVAFFRGETQWGHEGMDEVSSPVGIGFFNKARQILAFLPKGQIGTAQCHVLAGVYYAQLLRVYDFWTSIHEAAITFFNIISTSPQEKNAPDVIRGYWVTYILECTILSELDLPPSGLYQLQDSVPMPFGDDESQIQEQGSETECQFVLLANIALRRLLNRAYRSMSSPDWMSSVMNEPTKPSTTVNHELALQLDNWFRHLPPSIVLQMNSDNDRNRQTYPRNLLGLLRGRYWAAKFVIYRPYVYKALSSPPETLTAADFLNVQQCLEAGLKVPQEIGLLTKAARLIVSPFAPIRSFMATYTLLCAVQDAPHLRNYALAQLDLAEEIRQKIQLEFHHLSPLAQRDMELLERYRNYLETTQATEYH